MSAAAAILGFVTLQRLGELLLAQRNTRRLRAEGAWEAGAGHYPVIVLLHVAWLAGLWWIALLRGPLPVDVLWIAVFAGLQILRLWVIATLGRRWTTRIIILPGAPLVSSGPYRLLHHPNYCVVAGEILILPLAFGLVGYGVVFSVLNGLVLWWRIKVETAALDARM